MSSIDVFPLVVSSFALDGGAMFGVVPYALWAKQHAPDDQGRIDLVARTLVLKIKAEGRIVIVDSGMGSDWSPKERSRYKLDASTSSLEDGLAQLGIAADEVTDVILTHLHFDHAGGWIKNLDDGQKSPVFAHARHHVQQRHWKWAMQPSIRDKGSFIKENFEPLQAAGLLVFHDEDAQILDGISTIISDGHTPAMQIPIIGNQENTLAYPSDLIPTMAHGQAAWGMAYDLNPLGLIDEKRRFLESAARGGWTLVFEHDPLVEAATVRLDGDWFSLEPRKIPTRI